MTLDQIRERLMQIAAAAVPAAGWQPRTNLTVGERHVYVLVRFVDPDVYPARSYGAEDVEVDHNVAMGAADIDVIGDTIVATLDKALAFVSTEMPVPA